MRDIIQVITDGGLPDPVTVLQTTTMMATVTVPAAGGADLAAAVINDTAPGAVLGAAVPVAAGPAALTVTQTVMVMQSCPVVAAAPAVGAPIDTGIALAVPTGAPIAAAPAAGAVGAAVPQGGVGVQIVSLPPQAIVSRPPSVAAGPVQPLLPAGSGIVEGSVAGEC